MSANKVWAVINDTAYDMAIFCLKYKTKKEAHKNAVLGAISNPGHRFVVVESVYEIVAEVGPAIKVVHKKLPK